MHLSSTRYRITVLSLLIIAILPYLYVSLYCNPIADDFAYAFKGKYWDLLPALIGEYLNWNGRYVSNIFVMLNPIAFDSFIGYKLVPILLIICTVFSFYFFFRALTDKVINQYELFALSLVITLLYLHQMPIISEGIYMYTGAVTYQLGNVFLLLYAGALCQYIGKKHLFKSKIAHAILLIALMFLTIGFNETIMITVLLFSTGIYVISKLNKLDGRAFLFYLLIVCICFSCIVYFAPGNSTREAYFPNNHQLVNSLISSLAQCIRFFFDWISSAPLILLSILYYSLNKRLSEHVPIFRESFYLTPLISFALLFIVIFIGAFPAYWSTGILGQHRTMNVSYLLFIIAWFINLTVFYNKNLATLDLKHYKLRIVIYVLVWCSLVFARNGYTLLEDIRTGDIARFNTQMVERYSIIENSGDTIYFEPIKYRPKTLFVLDITDNPKNWQNEAYAIFFGKPDKPVMIKPRDQGYND